MASKGAVKAPETHRCSAVACDERCPIRHLMCSHHYGMLPQYLRDELGVHFRYGQEHGKVKATPAWIDTADRAIAAVADLEAAAA